MPSVLDAPDRSVDGDPIAPIATDAARSGLEGPGAVGTVAARRRSMAVDVLRGIAIVMMVFVDVPGDASHTPTQFQHVAWAGLHLADFVFPAFLVAAGAALGLGGRRIAIDTALWRASRLFAADLVLVAIKYFSVGFESGTLQLIAVAWLLGALAMRLSPRRRTMLAVGLMAAAIAVHWGNWGTHAIDRPIDSFFFGDRSDLGVLGMISAATAVMLSSVAAQTLEARRVVARARTLIVAGVVMVLAGGALVALGVPIVKRMWSPSYVLVTVGVVFAVWAALECVFVVDHRWALPLVALGRNALAVYVAMSLVASLVPDWFSQGLVARAGDGIGLGTASVLYSAVVAVALTVGAEVLRRRHIAIRL